MADINDLFEVFPDYNVFDDSVGKSPQPPKSTKNRIKSNTRVTANKPVKKAVPRSRNSNPDPKKILRDLNRKPAKKPAASKDLQDLRPRDDYGDDYGIYYERREFKGNFTTILFFPVLFMWLEATLRFGCKQTFLTPSLIYIALFSIAIGGIFTLLCTFLSKKTNRHFSRIFTLIVTLIYCYQMIFFEINHVFFTFSVSCPQFPSIEVFIEALVKQRIQLLIAVIPLCIFTLAGRFTFPFRKIRTSAKILLVLMSVILYMGTVGVMFLLSTTGIDTMHYSKFTNSQAGEISQEGFGLATMEGLDIADSLFKVTPHNS